MQSDQKLMDIDTFIWTRTWYILKVCAWVLDSYLAFDYAIVHVRGPSLLPQPTAQEVIQSIWLSHVHHWI